MWGPNLWPLTLFLSAPAPCSSPHCPTLCIGHLCGSDLPLPSHACFLPVLTGEQHTLTCLRGHMSSPRGPSSCSHGSQPLPASLFPSPDFSAFASGNDSICLLTVCSPTRTGAWADGFPGPGTKLAPSRGYRIFTEEGMDMAT